MIATIPFPNIDPVAFHLGPLAIRWYGIAYVLGFLVGYWGLRRQLRQGSLSISNAQLSDLLTWVAAGVILGGRLGWWLFYHEFTGVQTNWYDIFAIWRGGMSFHGGLVGVASAMLLWSWRNRASRWNVADAVAIVTPIGLLFGRIANFINAELVGRPSDLPWAVLFPGDSIGRHPSQLYEAVLEGPFLLALLLLIRRRPHQDGMIAVAFVIGYGLLRFLVEFTREPDEQLGFIAFGWLTMGQVLSLGLSVIGVLLMLGLSARRSPRAKCRSAGEVLTHH